MYILEYSPTEGYHISTAHDYARNVETCRLSGIEKDYELVGRYDHYDEAFDAMQEHKELVKGNYAA